MRVRVLPRELAARIINGTVATIGWAVGALTIVLTIPVLIETLVMRGRADDIPLPLALLLIILCGIAAVARWRRTEVVLIYLAVASVATIGYELALLDGDHAILDEGLFLVNRPTLALVAVGVTAATALSGILWCSFGLVVATSVSLITALIAGVPFRPGFGPLMVFIVAVIGYLTFAAIQNTQRRQVPELRRARGRDAAPGTRRGPRAAHHGGRARHRAQRPVDRDEHQRHPRRTSGRPVAGGPRAAAQRRVDLADHRDPDGRRRGRQPAQRDHAHGQRLPVARPQHPCHRVGLRRLPPRSGCRARPGRVGLGRVRERAATLRVAASRSSSSSTTTTSSPSWSPTRGPASTSTSVAPDRLGVRASMIDRMESVGGSARVWSSPGSGTSVMLTIPDPRSRRAASRIRAPEDDPMRGHR